MTSNSEIWNPITQYQPQTLAQLFAENGEKRLETLCHSIDVDGVPIIFDFSKTHLDDALLKHFEQLTKDMHLRAMRDQLFAGAKINNSEDRAVTHMAERGIGNENNVEQATANAARMAALVDALHDGLLGDFDHILHIGIGGSALGVELVMDALGRDDSRYDVAIVSNIDGAALEEVFNDFDPQKTLVCVASKTFTTAETLLNAQSAIDWMQDGGVTDPYGRIIALTAAPEKAAEWGVDETRILPFAETVGGRYSIWSSIGFPVALALGNKAFAEFRMGAATMDVHFYETPICENIPVLAAFADLLYTQNMGCQSRAVFAYDERLQLLPDYLQQLEMESNGKNVQRDGSAIARMTAPVTWGGVGTDAQHAVFQFLHQGQITIPVEFLAVTNPDHGLNFAHHRALLQNCFAQGAALMAGKDDGDAARYYPGNRPSTTILLDYLEPKTLGAMIAFYEHRTFVNATLLGINAFDQFGVELGKAMARYMDGASSDNAEALSFDLSTQALMKAANIND